MAFRAVPAAGMPVAWRCARKLGRLNRGRPARELAAAGAYRVPVSQPVCSAVSRTVHRRSRGRRVRDARVICSRYPLVGYRTKACAATSLIQEALSGVRFNGPCPQRNVALEVLDGQRWYAASRGGANASRKVELIGLVIFVVSILALLGVLAGDALRLWTKREGR